MDIIERGIAPQDKLYGATCTECKTKYANIKKAELKSVNDQRDPYSYFDCQVCNDRVYESQLVPQATVVPTSCAYDYYNK